MLDVRDDIGVSRETLKPTSRKRIPIEKAKQLLSPVSGKAMVRFKFRGIEIDYCEESNGVWLDAEEIERATRTGSSKTKERSWRSGLAGGLDAGVTANLEAFPRFLDMIVGSLFD